MKTFTLQLTLRFAVLVTLTTGLVLTAGGWLLRREAIAGLIHLHEVEADELGGFLGTVELSPTEVEQRIANEADSDAALFFIQVVGSHSNVLFRSPNLGGTLLPALPSREKNWQTKLPHAGEVLISDFVNGPRLIQIASPLDPMEHLMRNYASVSGLLLAGVALLSLALGYQFSRATLRPVRAIEATARRIRADNLSERIPVSAGHGELTSMIDLLNETFNRLQRSFEQVQRFTADASHELKTPLALARLNAEKLQEGVQNDPALAALASEVLDEIARLDRIIESLLFLAKTEGGALQVPKREINLVSFCGDFAEDASALVADKGMKFALTRNDAGQIWGEAGLLRQVLLNLVSNAIAASPPGGLITLQSYQEDGRAIFVVEDEGPGLPEDQLSRVFERFARYESGKTRSSPAGIGLGLAICRGIIELHGGKIYAENRNGKSGLRVKVVFPTDLDATS